MQRITQYKRVRETLPKTDGPRRPAATRQRGGLHVAGTARDGRQAATLTLRRLPVGRRHGAGTPRLRRGDSLASRRRLALPLIVVGLDGLAAALGIGALAPGVIDLPIAAALITIGLVGSIGGYRFGSTMATDRLTEHGQLAVVAIAASWLMLVIAQALGVDLSAFDSVVFALFLATSLSLSRILLRTIRPSRVERVVVIGAGLGARRVAALARRHTERRFEVIGCLDDDPGPTAPGDPEVIGRLMHLPTLLRGGEVDRVLVAFGSSNDEEVLHVLRKCDEFGLPIDVLPRFFDLSGHQPRAYRIGCTPLLAIKAHELSPLQRFAKRVVDIVGAGVILSVAAIPAVFVALAIKLGDGGSVFYRQRRIGKDGRPFDLFKFRTMVPDADKLGDERIAGLADGTMSVADAVTALKLEDDPRVTRCGRLLRSTSLDELPQLLNVLRGEMSLVGPRPLRAFEHDSLAGWQRDRERLKPGLTGLWQVSGRSDVRWDERMGMDYLYVRHWSLASDVRILCETVPILLGRRGAQ